MGDTKDLAMMLDAKIPIVVIESPDETRVLEFLARFAHERRVGYYEWTVTRGLKRIGYSIDSNGEGSHAQPDDLLAHIFDTRGPAIYALCDFHPYLSGEPKTIRRLKDIALEYENQLNTLVLVSSKVDLPPELGRLAASFNFRLPNDDGLMALVRKQAQQWAELHDGNKVTTDRHTLDKLIANLRGTGRCRTICLKYLGHASLTQEASNQDAKVSDDCALRRLRGGVYHHCHPYGQPGNHRRPVSDAAGLYRRGGSNHSPPSRPGKGANLPAGRIDPPAANTRGGLNRIGGTAHRGNTLTLAEPGERDNFVERAMGIEPT